MCQILVDKMRVYANFWRSSCGLVNQPNNDKQSRIRGLSQGLGEWATQQIGERGPRERLKDGRREPKTRKFDEVISVYECLKICVVSIEG